MSTPPPDMPTASPSDTERRDQLALERTRLANERTLLAYIRTAIMLAATGATLLFVYDQRHVPYVVGWALLAASGVVGMIGWHRFMNLSSRLR